MATRSIQMASILGGVLVLLLVSPSTRSQQGTLNRLGYPVPEETVTSNSSDVLKGLTHFLVSVDRPKVPDSEHIDLKQFRTEIELRLRQSGITLWGDDNKTKDSDAVFESIKNGTNLYSARLVFSPDVLTLKSGESVYTIDMKISENGYIVRPKKTMVFGIEPWSKTTFGICPEGKLQEKLLNASKNMADEFCNDYLKANPKK